MLTSSAQVVVKDAGRTFASDQGKTIIVGALKLAFVKMLSRYRLFGLYSIYKRGYLHDRGWFDSVSAKQAIDGKGKPIPWITYPSLEFLEERVRRDMAIFEYGCGNSTLWWASRVRRVVSCEHDSSWFERTKAIVPGNVELHHVSLDYGGDYSRTIARYTNEFDVIFIDGRDRVNCILHSLAALKPDGVVILDNSDEGEYADGIRFLSTNQFKHLHFTGPGPITSAVWQTTIFYREKNCLGI